MIFNMHNQNVRTVGLVVLGLTYLFFGAAVFNVIEKEREGIDRDALLKEESEITEKYQITSDDLKKLTKVLIKLEPHKAGRQWDFTGSLYFAIILLTTIGYGHSVPHTTSGKIFCMFYSLIGVPLYLVMFQAMGERINNAARYSMKRIGRRLGFKCTEVSLSTLVPFGLFSCVLTVTIGAISFSHFEGWPLLDSFYYCVVTLTTIGFGDYVPLQKGEALQKEPNYVVFSFIYILVGLTIIGAFVNLVVLRLMVTPATDEPLKEEENTLEDGDISERERQNGDEYFSGAGGNGTDISLPIEYRDGDTISGENGGPFAKLYSLPHTRLGDLELMWQEGAKDSLSGITRRQQSFRTSRENRFQYHPSSNTTKPHFSEADLYSLYSEIPRDEASRATSRREVRPATADAPISEEDATCAYDEFSQGSGSPTDAHNESGSQEFSTGQGASLKSKENGYSKWKCILCERSCVVCQQLFADHVISDEVFDDNQNSKDDGSALENGNDNNNKSAQCLAKMSKNGSQNALQITLNGTNPTPDLITLHMKSPSNEPAQNIMYSRSHAMRHSVPINSKLNVKMLLDSKPHRHRNLSLDSGYGGMLSLIVDEKMAVGGKKLEEKGEESSSETRNADAKSSDLELPVRPTFLTLSSGTSASESMIAEERFPSSARLSLSSMGDFTSLDEDPASSLHRRSACSLTNQFTEIEFPKLTEFDENQNIQVDVPSAADGEDKERQITPDRLGPTLEATHSCRPNGDMIESSVYGCTGDTESERHPVPETPSIVVTSCETPVPPDASAEALPTNVHDAKGTTSRTIERFERTPDSLKRDSEDHVLRLPPRRREELQQIIKSMCSRHHRQFIQLSNIFNELARKRIAEPIPAKVVEAEKDKIEDNSTPKNHATGMVADPAKSKPRSLVATRLCSNGSVITGVRDKITPRVEQVPTANSETAHTSSPLTDNEQHESFKGCASDRSVVHANGRLSERVVEETPTHSGAPHTGILPTDASPKQRHVDASDSVQNGRKQSKKKTLDIIRHFLSKTKENAKAKTNNGDSFHVKETALPCEHASTHSSVAGNGRIVDSNSSSKLPPHAVNCNGAAAVNSRRQYAFGASPPETQRNDELINSEGQTDHRRVVSCCDPNLDATAPANNSEYFLAKSMPRLHRDNWDTSYC